MSKDVKKFERWDGARALDIAGRFLTVLIIGLLGYVPVQYFSLGPEMVFPGFESETVSKNSASAAFGAQKSRPFPFYEEQIKARDLFGPLGGQQTGDVKILEKALPALHKSVKLIGILVDDDSKAIVEDLERKQTHFLSKGEKIGTALLEDILEDKVIFMYNDTHVEMVP